MNEEASNTATEKSVEPKLSVVMNGGSDTLESARIPVQFGVNAKLAEIQPTHVLVIIQHKSESESNTRGIRKLIPLSRGSDFICFDCAGEHVVTFIVLKILNWKIEKRFEKIYLKEAKPGIYENYILLRSGTHESVRGHVQFELFDDIQYVFVFEQKTISLPEELFAKKSKTWVWKWVNLYHRYEPTDECAYRKRMIYAFTLKPFVEVLKLMILLAIRYSFAIIASLWMIIAKSTVFILGWRPEPIFKDFGPIWSSKTASPDEIDWDITVGEEYGVWDSERGKYYPVTGASIVLMAVSIILTLATCDAIAQMLCDIKLLVSPIWIIITLVLCLTFACAFWTLSSWTKIHWIKRLRKKYEDYCWRKKCAAPKRTVPPVAPKVAKKQEAPKPDYYFEWLKGTLNADRLPKRVDIAKVPTAFKQPTIHRFRLSFNAMKAKVCKPFPRR